MEAIENLRLFARGTLYLRADSLLFCPKGRKEAGDPDVGTREEDPDMPPEDRCPYRLDSKAGEILCFDPWLAECIKPPVQVVEEWCSRRGFRSCPGFITYQKNTLAGERKHFMLC